MKSVGQLLSTPRHATAPGLRAGACRGQVLPRWLLVMGGVLALIVLTLVLFQRKLFVAFREMQSGSGVSVTNLPVTSVTNSIALPSNVVTTPGAPDAPVEVDRDKALELFTKATELMAREKFAEAADLFRESIKFDSESEDAHYNLGFALARLGQPEEAMREYREVLRILPDYAEAHNNLGNLLKNQGKLDEAIVHFNAALKIIPDHASAQNNLGVALAQQGKVNDAIVSFSKAVQLQPDYVDAHYNLGSAYMTLGRLEEAIKEFRTALRLQPNSQNAVKALLKAQQALALRKGP